MTGQLYHTPAHIVHTWVLAQGGGYISDPTAGQAWPGFINNTKSDFNPLVAFNDTAGVVSGRLQVTGDDVEAYGFQLYVRGSSQKDSFEKIAAIHNLLATTCLNQNVDVDQVAYRLHSISPTSPFIPLGRSSSEDSNFLYTKNYLAHITVRYFLP